MLERLHFLPWGVPTYSRGGFLVVAGRFAASPRAYSPVLARALVRGMNDGWAM